MKTYYYDKPGPCGIRYHWDPSIKSWTVIHLDKKTGNQVGDAEYYANKGSLLAIYSRLKFKMYHK